ncbi:hypothetical protein NDU88_007551 [Pleurodeles waltl]|uniref:Transmembrane protein n=1 Tax=Pleurodeles waltl TaxID=8319 RepID=A0AAV7N2C8_PLEWA|nr:hypothetical protein NDU88_007551 [Pleurodeles waltl]
MRPHSRGFPVTEDGSPAAVCQEDRKKRNERQVGVGGFLVFPAGFSFGTLCCYSFGVFFLLRVPRAQSVFPFYIFEDLDIRVPGCDGVFLQSALRSLSVLFVCCFGHPDIWVPVCGVVCSLEIRYPATVR